MPNLAERLRMITLDTIAARMPIAFMYLNPRVLAKIEDDLDREIEARVAGLEERRQGAFVQPATDTEKGANARGKAR